ncbi:MAG: hypothetical protein M1820_002115 [Bogoriella megaspora]|nr:MAG: hypothetical protein M1820_002115 [Bogoriella megaspora]
MTRRIAHSLSYYCRPRSHCSARVDPLELPVNGIGGRGLLTTRRATFATVTETRIPEATNLVELSRDGVDLKDETVVLPLSITLHQARLHSPLDELRDRLLGGCRAQQRFAHLRSPELSWQKFTPVALGRVKFEEVHLIPNANKPIWENAEEHRARVYQELGKKAMRKLMREQFMRCRTPRDILQIVAVAMQKRETAVQLTHLQSPIMAALYRTRNVVSDLDVLSVLNVIINRFRQAGLTVSHEYIPFGLRFAARARSLPAMKRYLKDAKEMGVRVSGRAFRSIIAKFSIGIRGFGEIRNGRWKKDQLLQVLLGFEGMDPEAAYNLGAFLKRDDWVYFHGWVAVLARCKATKELWREWEWWRDSEERRNERKLSNSSTSGLTTKLRGDIWFVEQLLFAGEHERAWQVFNETDVKMSHMSANARTWLMDHPEYAKEWDESMKQALMNKYVKELEKIEQALGVKWISKHNHGYHSTEKHGDEAEEVLEMLSEPPPHVRHGYPEE